MIPTGSKRVHFEDAEENRAISSPRKFVDFITDQISGTDKLGILLNPSEARRSFDQEDNVDNVPCYQNAERLAALKQEVHRPFSASIEDKYGP